MGMTGMNGWQLLFKGGPMMVPILLCSIAAMAIVFEKFWYLAKNAARSPQFKYKVFEAVRKNAVKEAVALCESEGSPMANILKAGILKTGTSRDEIREAMEAVSLYEVPQLEKGLNGLVTIAYVSPLLGLLGTVLGLTVNFYTIQLSAGQQTPMTPGDLAGGIWQALLTTVGGLTVAIPTYVFYQYFQSRIGEEVVGMERAATELLHLLTSVSEAPIVSETEE